MPAAIAVPLLIKGGTTIAAAKMQSGAATDAARIQGRSADEAIADERQQRTYRQGQYADYLQRLSPYQQQGQTAVSTLSQSAGVPSNRYADMFNRTPTDPLNPAAPSPTNQMVLLKAPNGQTKAVPRDQVDHFLARGAMRVS